MAFVWLIAAIITFLLLYGATVYFRFAYRDIYGGTSGTHLVNNLETVTVQADAVDDRKSLGTVVFLCIEPLVTSLLALLLGIASSDEVKQKRYKLRRMITQLDESIAELESSISCRKRTEQEELDTDEKLMQLAMQDVEARSGWMRSAARQYLTEYLQNPSAISVLSHELDNETRLLLEEALTLAAGGTEETDNQIPADREDNGRGEISAFPRTVNENPDSGKKISWR
jgi:phosphate/sulfate permease